MNSNLPPGVTPDMIPGDRPEDRAWNAYWDTERPDMIFAETCPEYYHGDLDSEELLSWYDKDSDFKKAIDKDFQSWWTEPDPNDDRL